ncbi:MAG: type II secretion system protein GspG, partial [Planctomycetota bacterium]
MHRPTPRSRTAAFTLIEIVIAVTIIIILAGLVAPRISNWSEEARRGRAATEMKSVKRALEYMYQDLGVFPADVSRTVDPGLVDPARVPTAQRPNWRGPYLDRWPEEGPMGGAYDYEYTNMSDFNFDGTSGNEVVLSLREGTSTEQAQAIDDAIDDGDLNSGMVRQY